MPERMPWWEYTLYSFEAEDTDSIQEILKHRNLDYRDIISITSVTIRNGTMFRVFYGLKKMR